MCRINHEKLTCFVEESPEFIGYPICVNNENALPIEYEACCKRCTGLTLKVTSEGGQADA